MRTVTLDVRSRASALADVGRTWKAGKAQESPRISFPTPQLLLKVLGGKRLGLVEAMCGAGPLTIREAAKLVGRDVKAVHSDITALVKAGILSRENKGVEFPYDAVKVEFVLKASEMRKVG
jgi:predicted transcriptional regulator